MNDNKRRILNFLQNNLIAFEEEDLNWELVYGDVSEAKRVDGVIEYRVIDFRDTYLSKGFHKCKIRLTVLSEGYRVQFEV